jgi:glycosyltransferase involved in cell wall biosynthesis
MNLTNKQNERQKTCLQGISFIIPCFKEPPEVLQRTIDQIRHSMGGLTNVEFELIVVDDGTPKIDYSLVHGVDKFLKHIENRGYGGSIKTGIKVARYSKIAITDADDTYPCHRFAEFVELSRDFDMVIGSRPWKDISSIRRFPKKVITRFAGYVAGCEIPDLNSGMRVFSREIFESRHRLFPDAFSFSSTLTMVALTQHFPTRFVGINYGRRTGTSKIRPFKDTLRFIVQLTRLSLYFHPLRVFMPLAAAFLMAAILRGVRDFTITGQLGNLCLVVFQMGFQVFFFGLIAEIINKK